MFAKKGGKISMGSLKAFIEATYDDKVTEYKGYILDKTLSTIYTKVFYNPEFKTLLISERPTSSARDVLSDFISGIDITGLLFKKIDSRFKKSFSVFNKALKKYSDRNNSILVGYSLGAIVCEEFMRENKEAFDEVFLISKPVIPSRVMSQPLKNVTEIRSSRDPTSLLKPIQKKADREIVIPAMSLNPITEHRITNVFPRVSSDLQVGDENVLSGVGVLKDKPRGKLSLSEEEMKSLTVAELKKYIVKYRKIVDPQYRQLYKVTGKSKEELKDLIRGI